MKTIAACIVLVLLATTPAVADDPLAGIGELLTSGRTAEARARVAKARETFVAQGDRAGEAAATLLLAMSDVAAEDLAAARGGFEQAAAKFVAADEHFGAWLSLTTLAQIEFLTGRRMEAVALHERALELLRTAGDPKSRFSLQTFNVLGPAFGAPPEQVQLVSGNPELMRMILLRLADVMTRSLYGQALVEIGDLEKADAQLSQAASQSAMFGGMLDGLITTPLGDLRRRQWRFDEARRYYEKALSGGSAGAMPMMTLPLNGSTDIDILGKLADLEVLSGRVDEAMKANDRVLALARASSPKREPWLLQERGTLLQKAGRFADAEKALDQALALAEKNGDPRNIAAVHSDLGSLHYYVANYGKAASHLVKGIEVFQNLKETGAEAMLWTSLAEIYLITESPVLAADAIARAKDLAKNSKYPMAGAIVKVLEAAQKVRQGDPVDLQSAFDEWMATAERVPIHAESKRVLRNIMTLQLGGDPVDPALVSGEGAATIKPMALVLKGVPRARRGDFAAAREVWTEALSLVEDRRDVRGLIEGLIGSAYWREGNTDAAIRYFTLSTKTLEDVGQRTHVEEMLAGYFGSPRRIFFEMLVEMLVREGRVAEAFGETERARARAFLQLIGNRRVSDRGADPQLVLQADIQRRRIAAMEVEIRKAATGTEEKALRSMLALARNQYEALMVRVKASNPEYAALTSVETVPADVVRKELPDRTTLVTYFVSPNATHAWVIDRATMEYVKLPVDERAMRRIGCWAREFRGGEVPRGTTPPAEACKDAANADEAYDALIAPLRSKIRNDRLVIVPHRELHHVPFAALRDAKRKRYLIEDYTIVYAPSATAWRFLRQHETPVGGGALVLGNPAGTAARLPGAEREAAIVAKHLGTEALIGADAAERLFYRLGGKVDLLHVAAHAEYEIANPLFSHIALAPEGEYDGSLMAHEILSDVDLSGVNLVVLSACDTAVGKMSEGDEIVGLTRSLLYAGTPGVVSTLWQIDDVASTALMDAFYERLVAGASAAEALRAAQLSMLRGDAFPSPRFWAAFTLTGDPQGRWKQPTRTAP